MNKRTRRPNGIRSQKISVSVATEDLRILRARARRAYGGNLSAVIHEIAEAVKRADAADEVLSALGGERITEREMEEIRREAFATGRRRRRRRHAA